MKVGVIKVLRLSLEVLRELRLTVGWIGTSRFQLWPRSLCCVVGQEAFVSQSHPFTLEYNNVGTSELLWQPDKMLGVIYHAQDLKIEFKLLNPARVGQHKRVLLRDNEGVCEVLFPKGFRNIGLAFGESFKSLFDFIIVNWGKWSRIPVNIKAANTI